MTLPTMLFLQNRLGDAGSLALVEQVLTDSTPGDHEVTAAVLAIRHSGALEQALDMARQYVDQAREALCEIPAGEARDMLEAVAEHAVQRHF
uniref:Polyprenyl synthetase family protein n=1 Tax=Thermorudis sp. TaxID=1969470 RepID=A0A7C2WR02_9BACT